MIKSFHLAIKKALLGSPEELVMKDLMCTVAEEDSLYQSLKALAPIGHLIDVGHVDVLKSQHCGLLAMDAMKRLYLHRAMLSSKTYSARRTFCGYSCSGRLHLDD